MGGEKRDFTKEYPAVEAVLDDIVGLRSAVAQMLHKEIPSGESAKVEAAFRQLNQEYLALAKDIDDLLVQFERSGLSPAIKQVIVSDLEFMKHTDQVCDDLRQAGEFNDDSTPLDFTGELVSSLPSKDTSQPGTSQNTPPAQESIGKYRKRIAMEALAEIKKAGF